MTDRGAEVGDLGFDAVVTKLRTVVERLEAGQIGLEDALAVYEQGVHLARRGHALLEAAERKVEVLVSTAVVTPPAVDTSTSTLRSAASSSA